MFDESVVSVVLNLECQVIRHRYGHQRDRKKDTMMTCSSDDKQMLHPTSSQRLLSLLFPGIFLSYDEEGFALNDRDMASVMSC
jgi:hypothetical protein